MDIDMDTESTRCLVRIVVTTILPSQSVFILRARRDSNPQPSDP